MKRSNLAYKIFSPDLAAMADHWTDINQNWMKKLIKQTWLEVCVA